LFGGRRMKKFEGWRTEELQFIATMVAGRDMLELDVEQHLYNELIREIRNRRIAEELFQMKLEGIEEE
jgi:alpha-D-ribose 1-methylphosphonate 5-phosphate C-P lyase